MGFLSKILNVPTEKPAKEFKDPIFLIGLMRSGTTLLMHSLSEHPQLLKVGFELNAMWREIGGLKGDKYSCPRLTEDDFHQRYLKNVVHYFSDYLAESKTILRHLSRYDQRRVHGSGGVFYDWDNVIPLNKSPHLSNKVRYLAKLFPRAKFVVLVRPIESQCASLKKHFQNTEIQKGKEYFLPDEDGSCWTRLDSENKIIARKTANEDFSSIVKSWISLNHTMLADLDQVDNGNIIIDYNDLVLDQAETMERIFQFLSLDPKHKSKEIKIVNKKRKIHNTTTKGDPLTKWKKNLSEVEKVVITDLVASNKEKYDYINKRVSDAKPKS